MISLIHLDLKLILLLCKGKLMNNEIERKFWVNTSLFNKENYKDCFNYTIHSGYTSKETSSRINLNSSINGKSGCITFKGSGNISRKEYEYEIPADEAEQMINDKSICPYSIKKQRYVIPFGGNEWEVDVYLEPLLMNGIEVYPVVAEIELSSEDQEFEKPDWVGEELTFKKGFSNHKLAVSKTIP